MRLLFLLFGLSAAAGTTTPATSSTSRDAVVASVNAAAIDLYQYLPANAGNLVFSPLSAAAVLTLVWLGAGGETARQLGSALRLPPSAEEVADGWGQLMDALQSSNEDVLLRIANMLALQSGFEVKDTFRQLAERNFKARVVEMNFRNDTENSRIAINRWVEQFTEGKITNLLAPGFLAPSTNLVLVNAIYFNAKWKNSFQKRLTSIEQFWLSDYEHVNVSTMHGTFDLQYGRILHLNASALILPYEEGQFQSEMLILLPDSLDGLDNLERSLQYEDILSIPFRTLQVDVSLPKYTIETTQQLVFTLLRLGVTDIFGPQANLSGISDQSLLVDGVVQKAYIKVDENGTEAAAATAIGVRATAVFFVPRVSFIVDHPFMYFLRTENAILFMGKVTNPLQ